MLRRPLDVLHLGDEPQIKLWRVYIVHLGLITATTRVKSRLAQNGKATGLRGFDAP